MGGASETRGDDGAGTSAGRGVDGCAGTVSELKDELDPLWEEATMTASADVEGCASELSRSVQCSLLREPD